MRDATALNNMPYVSGGAVSNGINVDTYVAPINSRTLFLHKPYANDISEMKEKAHEEKLSHIKTFK